MSKQYRKCVMPRDYFYNRAWDNNIIFQSVNGNNLRIYSAYHLVGSAKFGFNKVTVIAEPWFFMDYTEFNPDELEPIAELE